MGAQWPNGGLFVEFEEIKFSMVCVCNANLCAMRFKRTTPFIRVVNDQTNVEIVRFDLNEDYSTETAMIFGELYRHNGEWKFRAVGQGYNGGLRAMCGQYGISI